MLKIIKSAIVLGLMLLLQATSYAAPPVEGFMGVPWGASRQQVDAAMAEQGFIKLAKPDWCATVPGNHLCDPGLVNYDGRFAGERAEIRFLFLDKQMYYGWVDLTMSRSVYLSDQVNAYKHIKAIITEKYGTPATDERNVRPKGWGESARASWLLTAGQSGDQIEIIVLMEGVFTYSKPSPGYVGVFYINRSLEHRLRKSNI